MRTSNSFSNTPRPWQSASGWEPGGQGTNDSHQSPACSRGRKGLFPSQRIVDGRGFMCITLAVVVLVHFFQAAQLNSAGAKLSALESAMVKINKQNQDLEKIKL